MIRISVAVPPSAIAPALTFSQDFLSVANVVKAQLPKLILLEESPQILWDPDAQSRYNELVTQHLSGVRQ